MKLTDGGKKEGKLLVADEQGILIEEKITVKGKKATFAEARLIYDQVTEAIVLVSFK